MYKISGWHYWHRLNPPQVLNPNPSQLLLKMNTVFQTYSFVKSLKGDSVYLYIVDFGSEFNGFGFLASDNGAKVMPDTHGWEEKIRICK
ncbi:hypothetical protein DWX88_22500 [Bacteroides xylanisolvens]|nr:hypothetical protein DWX88_22500 [Bacteroides xylanisolvens]